VPADRKAFAETVERSILMEMKAIHLYTLLANRAEDEETRRILYFLAEMEESHVDRLVDLFGKAGKDAEAAFARVDVVKAFREEGWTAFRAWLAGAGLTESSPPDEYLTFASVAEAHAQAHYERLAGREADPEMKALFATLAREEAGHGERIRHIRDQLRRGRTF
jgi:rubrerythrin